MLAGTGKGKKVDILREIETIREERKLSVCSWNTNPYRILIREKDGITAYYCSIPLFDEENKLVLPQWNSLGGKRFFRGINALVEADGDSVRMENKCGKAEVEFFSDVELLPTLNGIAVFAQNSVSFALSVETPRPIWENGRFFNLMQEGFVPFLTVDGLYQKNAGHVKPLHFLFSSPDGLRFRFEVEGGAEELAFEINLHAKKLVLDTTVESKNPELNNAFGGIAFLGTTAEYGEQMLYSRFENELFQDLRSYVVKEAQLYLPHFGGEGRLDSYRMTLPWCSFGSSWKTKVPYAEFLHTGSICRRFAKMEVTEIIRDIFRVKDPGNYGFILKGSDSGYSAVSTGDNYYRPQILEIKLKKNG